MGNPVGWFEILGPEPERTARFYSDLFGWHTETFEGGYIAIDTHSGSGTNGGFAEPQGGSEPGSIFYVQDPDIEALLDKAGTLGAKTLVPVTEIPNMVTFATFADPFGCVIGLMKGDEDPTASPGQNPPVDWFELSCSDPESAWDFYRELFGWKITGEGGEGFLHGGVEPGAGGTRGGIATSRDGSSAVAMYAAVDDVAGYLQKAESLGGVVDQQPLQVDEETIVGMLRDPQGTTFGLYSEKH